jgi:hypothetical protein
VSYNGTTADVIKITFKEETYHKNHHENTKHTTTTLPLHHAAVCSANRDTKGFLHRSRFVGFLHVLLLLGEFMASFALAPAVWGEQVGQE